MRRLAVLTLLAALAGCSQETRRDESVRWLAPPDGARVRLPILLQWSADAKVFRGHGFDGSTGGSRGVYAVFVDTPPIRPGAHIDSAADGDRTCETSPGCPDRTWLADNGIHLTTRPQLALRGVPEGSGRRSGDHRRHVATVVLLDGRGRRIGEGAWTRAFYARAEEGR